MTVVLVPNESVPPAAGAAEAADLVLARLADLDPDAIGADPVPGERRRRAPRRPSVRRTIRYYLSRLVVAVLVRAWLRVRLEGRDRLPAGPAIYCFNHLSWTDPFMLMAVLPLRPRLFFFGPKEEDMLVGGRNRLMVWTGSAIPYKPGKNDLLDATRRVAAVVEQGGVVAIAGEGRIHVRRIGPPAAQRGGRVLRDPLGRPARPDRDQRDELAALRRSHPRPGGGAVHHDRPADARGDPVAHRGRLGVAPRRWSRTRPTCRRPVASVGG